MHGTGRHQFAGQPLEDFPCRRRDVKVLDFKHHHSSVEKKPAPSAGRTAHTHSDAQSDIVKRPTPNRRDRNANGQHPFRLRKRLCSSHTAFQRDAHQLLRFHRDSIGNCCSTSRQKPLTISDTAIVLGMPPLQAIEQCPPAILEVVAHVRFARWGCGFRYMGPDGAGIPADPAASRHWC